MTLKTKFEAPFEVKSVQQTGEFEGYASVFGNKDSHDDVIVKGAFSKSIAEWKSKGRMPSLLWQHKRDEPIGVYTEIKEDDYGLYVKGKLLVDDDPLAKRAHAHMKAGSISGLSIGYRLMDWEYDKEMEAWRLKEIDLREVSLVTFPSNDESRINNVKSSFELGEIPKPKELERALRDVGMSQKQAKAFMSGGYSAITQRDVEDETAQALELLKSINF
ncbi:HK97 family phage prohead protease [Catenovulum sediminis]|uniref:HK97 family phage prohead protease n=1 Tax=Catenovulum sediminis TaxID=1740262 RepID=UPI00118052F2|nr:HK97 family phage prohead protease [Catenovulum sediminis]